MVGFVKSKLSEQLKKEGKSKNQSDSRFDKEELRIGTLIETEHTKDEDAAKEIAKDHLEEDKEYYKNKIFKKERQDAIKHLDNQYMKSKQSEVKDIQDDEEIEQEDTDEDESELTIYEECAIEIMLDKKAPKTYPSVLQEM